MGVLCDCMCELGVCIVDGGLCCYCWCQDGVHPSDMDFSKLHGKMDPSGKYVISTRIRVGRNIRGFGLMPGITREDRAKVEALVSVWRA